MSETSTVALEPLLKKVLEKVPDIKALVLSTYDGVELMTVYQDQAGLDTLKLDKQSIDCLVLSYATSLVQANKMGLGLPLHSLTWTERGTTIVHLKLEALVLTIIMDDGANLGLIDEHYALFVRVLQPFSTANFINIAL
mmetsp:Transcript_22922/g.38229  ORF Transcript_22922/g.38229 Transcript_22922/m.38229 type:complete len:139 (+) Transcript_22922:58-474(+)